jgi:cystatin-A/B
VFERRRKSNKMMGGASEPKEPTEAVKTMLGGLRDEAQRRAQSDGWNGIFTKFEAVKMLTQVVAGTNYFIKVQTDDAGGCAHLRVFQSLPHVGAGPELVAVRPGLKDADELEYFEG